MYVYYVHNIIVYIYIYISGGLISGRRSTERAALEGRRCRVGMSSPLEHEDLPGSSPRTSRFLLHRWKAHLDRKAQRESLARSPCTPPRGSTTRAAGRETGRAGLCGSARGCRAATSRTRACTSGGFVRASTHPSVHPCTHPPTHPPIHPSWHVGMSVWLRCVKRACAHAAIARMRSLARGQR